MVVVFLLACVALWFVRLSPERQEEGNIANEHRADNQINIRVWQI